jgi:hypothetical protein
LGYSFHSLNVWRLAASKHLGCLASSQAENGDAFLGFSLIKMYPLLCFQSCQQ